MLYQFHEMNRTLLSPLIQWAEASSKLFTNPVSPLAHMPFSQRIAAGYELMYRLGKDYEKPEFGIKLTPVQGLAHTAPVIEKVAENKAFCRLLHFRKDIGVKELAARRRPAGRRGAPRAGRRAARRREAV